MSHKPISPAVNQDIIQLYDEYTHAPCRGVIFSSA